MSSKILSEAGKKVILLGNEAIVRGALEAGVEFASTYPGTPASEIGDSFSAVSKQAGIYFEYSANEKVAFEAATGAALSGVRSIVSFKHYGLNVASDSIFPLPYFGVNAGMVIVFADDPSCWSSVQSEQDSRYYAIIAHIPMLEPSSPQECKEYMKIAFELSEKLKYPVFVRLTTRVSHAKGIVKFDSIISTAKTGKFEKNPVRFGNFPPKIMKNHDEMHKTLEKFEKISEKSPLNFISNGTKGKFGIIASGVSFNYVIDAIDELKAKIPVLKLGITYPLPEQKIKSFIKSFSSVLVAEELEPFLEDKVRILAREVNPKLKIHGKDVLPNSGEFSREIVLRAVADLIGKKSISASLKKHAKIYSNLNIAKRFALLCPGCPHRASFYAAKVAGGKETIYAGDVGCYILGIHPPLSTQDFIFSMGASEGIAHGIRKVTDQKCIVFIGDSTFFHAGFPGLVNTVFNKSNPLIIVLDNRITAMTGHQTNPGVGITGMGEETKAIAIEDIAKACKIDNVKVLDPFNVNEMVDSVKEFLSKQEVSVIVAKRECQLLATRAKTKSGIKIPKFEVSQPKCTKCGLCLNEFACPAIFKEGGSFFINTDLCTGCAVCFQICPYHAIQVKEE